MEMAHKKRGNFTGKHPDGRKVDPEIAEAVKKRSANGKITCADAFSISSDLKVSKDEVGFTIDSLEIHMVKCQLGLFGYQPQKKIVEAATTVSRELEAAIQKGLVKDRLPCAAVWEIADLSGIGKMSVASACEALNIKIGTCQLGAF